jgi:hypothetical protein
MVHDEDYVESIRSSTKWWDSVFIGSFAQMASHYAHTTMNKRQSALDDTPLPQVMHVTYPNEPITEDQLVTFPSNVTRVVSVVHQSQHYAVLEINIPGRRVVIFDGLNKPLLQWIDHVISSLKRTRLIGLDATYEGSHNGEFTENTSDCRNTVTLHQGYLLTFDVSPHWGLERGQFLKQLEGFDCEPIACTKILKIFGLVTKFKVNIAYSLGTIRSLVTEQWKGFLQRCNNNLVVWIQQREPLTKLRQEYASMGEDTTYQSNTAMSQSYTAAFDPLDVCFCFSDKAHMDIVRLVCCKQSIHQECLMIFLQFQSSCPYCCQPINNIASVGCYPAIDRTKDLPSSPMVTPKQRQIGKKRDVQEMEIDDAFGSPTPQRLVDKMRSVSQEKKQENQIN